MLNRRAEDERKDQQRKDTQRAAKAGMGSVARKGAGQVRRPGMPQAKFDRGPGPGTDDIEVWTDEGSIRRAAQRAVGAPVDRDRPKRRPKKLPAAVLTEIGDAVGPRRASKVGERLGEAVTAFDAERYNEARLLLAKLVAEIPDAAAARELLGLTYYRMGRWKQAIGEFEAFRALTGSTDQHPVLMDCYRALKRFHELDDLWEELRAASPTPELMAEGRIVAAGSLAERGRLPDAVTLLERSLKTGKHVADHHLRQWYALADLYDRGGDAPRARSLFMRVATHDPDFVDVRSRIAALGH